MADIAKKRLVVSILLFCLVVLFNPPAYTQTDSEDNWAYQRYQSVIDALLPIKLPGEGVGYRFLPAGLVLSPEISFVLKIVSPYGSQQGHYVAELKRANAGSILGQLIKLHHESPTANLADLRKRIGIETRSLSETNCPGIRSQFEKLERVSFTPPPSRMVVLDAPTHEFWIGNGRGTMAINIYAASGAEHPLVAWAEETWKELDACSSVKSPS